MRNTGCCGPETTETLRRLRRALAAFCGALLLAGCVVIPVGEEAPFDSPAQNFKTGQTTRKEVLFTLGEPLILRREEKLFAYMGYQLQAAMLYAAASPEGGAAGSLGFGKAHVLAITFDDRGIVQSVELSAKAGLSGARGAATEQCLKTGECFAAGKAGAVAFATETEDRAAKTFAVRPEGCAVYLYADERFDFSVILDRRERLANTNSGFFLWHLTPGPHRVSAAETYYGEGDAAEVDCRAGEVLYLRFFSPGPFQGMKLELTPAAEAQEEIRAGRLVLDNL